MAKFFFLLLQVAVIALGGCVREKTDQAVSLPEPPQVEYQISRIAVLPFGTDRTVPPEVRDKIYRSFIDYLIKRRKVFVVHPKIVWQFVEPDKPILDPEKALEIANRLGVDGIVIGFLSDYCAEPKVISFDTALYPVVNVSNPICVGHKRYDSQDRTVISSMKGYAKMFSWNKLPLGWERVRIKLDIFCDFVAWDMVKTFF